MNKITIIGAGLGGLTAGALLAKEGYKVTVFEQHYVPGGCATTFKRKGGYTCEVGLHEMDGVHSNPLLVDVLNTLDIYDNIEFVKPKEFFKIHSKHGTFVMPEGIDNAKKALIEKFPEEEEAIHKYFEIIKSLAGSFSRLIDLSWYHYAFFPFYFWKFLMYKPKNTTEVLDSLFKSEELKLILSANTGYYNDSTDTLSFLFHAVAQYSYYDGGAYYIKGGSGRLSEYLSDYITSKGGDVILSATVTACSDNKVEYIHKKEKSTLSHDKVISNISPEQSYALYDVAYKETKPIGDSLITVYLGFKENIKKVYGEGAYSTFIFDKLSSVSCFNAMTKGELNERGFVFVDYSQIDADLTKDKDKSFAVIATLDSMDQWKNLDTEAYEKKKKEFADKMMNDLEKYYPKISGYVEYMEVGTAKTMNRYLKTPEGTPYGFKPTPKEFFRIPKVKSNKIDNLYFVGQWVIAGGFSPAIMSGWMCSNSIQKNN